MYGRCGVGKRGGHDLAGPVRRQMEPDVSVGKRPAPGRQQQIFRGTGAVDRHFQHLVIFSNHRHFLDCGRITKVRVPASMETKA